MPDIFLMIIVLSVVLEALLFFVVLKGAFKNYEKKIGAPTKSGFLYILTAVYLAFCALMNYPAEWMKLAVIIGIWVAVYFTVKTQIARFYTLDQKQAKSYASTLAWTALGTKIVGGILVGFVVWILTATFFAPKLPI